MQVFIVSRGSEIEGVAYTTISKVFLKEDKAREYEKTIEESCEDDITKWAETEVFEVVE